MKIRARFFAHYRELFGAADREFAIHDGASVREALDALCDTPERRNGVFDGRLRPGVVVMTNGVSILSLDGLSTVMRDGDTIAVFPLLGGG
jgi:MoaD family protein